MSHTSLLKEIRLRCNGFNLNDEVQKHFHLSSLGSWDMNKVGVWIGLKTGRSASACALN